MPRWLRIVLGIAAVLLVAGFGLWRWLDASEPVPEQTSYRIDLDALHELAGSLPGPKPRAIRSVLVADAALPRGVIFAGEPFEPQHNVHQVFQLVYDGGFGLIDTAFPPEAFERVGAFGDGSGRYHADGWEQVRPRARGRRFHRGDARALRPSGGCGRAAGRAREPAPPQRAPARERAGARRGRASRRAPRSALAPLPEVEAQAIAPGVVLLAAPGHTPGSQIVYVERADGRTALFLGDVAWHSDQIRELRYRPRHVTLVLGENRAQVLGEFRALHELGLARPDVVQVVSHDPDQRAALLADGLLVDGLELP